MQSQVVGPISSIDTHFIYLVTYKPLEGKRMVEQLSYEGIVFPVATKYYGKIEEQNSINIYVFGNENKQFYPIYVSEQHNAKVLKLLLITEGKKTHCVLIKDFNRLLFNKT